MSNCDTPVSHVAKREIARTAWFGWTSMDVGESPAVARHRLRSALRRAREEKGLTQGEVATSLDWSLSKVNRIEAGEVAISVTDLQALLRLLGIGDHQEVETLLEEARAARRRGWWDRSEYREHLTPAMIQSLQFESDASAIRSFQPTLVPGLLQTPAYASAAVDVWSGELSQADRAARLKVRTMRREQLFSRPDPPAYLLALDESVLMREVGGPEVMSEQLADLLSVVRSGRITARILPFKHASVYAFSLFVIYTDDDEDVALYQESHLIDDLIYSPEAIRRHRHVFERVWGRCMSVEASTRLIEARSTALRSELDRQGPVGLSEVRDAP